MFDQNTVTRFDSDNRQNRRRKVGILFRDLLEKRINWNMFHKEHGTCIRRYQS